MSDATEPMTDGSEPRAIDEYSYPWAQTIDSVDGGRTIRIPWLNCDDIEAGSVWVFRDDALTLAAMLTDVAAPAPDETVHACPPDGSAVTPCCGRTPFELPDTDRMTLDPQAVTCTPAPAEARTPDVTVGPTPAGTVDNPDGLRESYAEAIEADLEQFFRDHPEEPRNSPWVLGMRDAAAAVRAAPAVPNPEVQQLRDELQRLREESPWLRATAEDLAAVRATVARVARLADEYPAGIDTALILAALDGQAAEDPETQQLREEINGWRRKAIRRAIRLGRHETTLAALREFAAEEVTARNGWGDGYREAKRDLTELLDTLAPTDEPAAADQPAARDR